MVLACLLDVSPRFVISVKVCSVLLDAGVYSQHGSTLLHDGAISNWKESVPGGMALSSS